MNRDRNGQTERAIDLPSFRIKRREEGGKENNGGNDQRDVRRLGRDGRDGHDDDDARKTMKGEGECVACPKKVARRRFSSGRAK